MPGRRVASCLLVLLVLTGCGGGTKNGNVPAVVKVDDTTAITTAWETFFNASGTVDAHVALLEDGSTFKGELTTVANSPQSKGLTAKVDKVVVTGDRATVTYDLLNSGTALLTMADGFAVKVKGTWKVSKQTYCQLAKLQSPGPHPGCS